MRGEEGGEESGEESEGVEGCGGNVTAGRVVVVVTGAGLRRVERRAPLAGRIVRAGGAGALVRGAVVTFLPFPAGFFFRLGAGAGLDFVPGAGSVEGARFVVAAGFAAATA